MSLRTGRGVPQNFLFLALISPANSEVGPGPHIPWLPERTSPPAGDTGSLGAPAIQGEWDTPPFSSVTSLIGRQLP